MIEVEYYFDTSRRWIIEFADAFSHSTGTAVSFSNNALHFPLSIAEGRCEYYELNEGLGMFIMDCIFHEDILIKKKKLAGNDYYSLLFHVCGYPLEIRLTNGVDLNLSQNLIKSVVLSLQTVNASVFFKKDVPVRILQIFFHRSWALRNLNDTSPMGLTLFRKFSNTEPIQELANFDKKSYEMVNEILALNTARVNLIQLLEGYACQLTALFFNNLKEEYTSGKEKLSPEAMRITALKEAQEQNLSDILLLPQAATACLMSTSKFTAMFTALFHENYGKYFRHLKMKRAKELLEEGYTVNDAATMTGYDNTGHFAKMFKKHFGVTPGLYKVSSKT